MHLAVTKNDQTAVGKRWCARLRAHHPQPVGYGHFMGTSRCMCRATWGVTNTCALLAII